ncbi:MAG: DNA helicase RecQ [Desulfovibrionales bacterium]
MNDTPLSILKQIYGYPAFIGSQEEIITHILAGRDGVVLMPTGGGKSVCYQIPAMLLEGTAVIVSPLIALMRDQVQGLTQMGVQAACLNSSLPAGQAREVEQRLAKGELDLIYVAPERLLMDGFLALLDRIKICLFAIDEAHCVSQWGHDFRPEYTRLARIKERFPAVPRIALTATADGPTREDILQQLGLENARVFAAGFDRPNIRYLVLPKERPEAQLLQFIREEHPGEAGIVYRMSRKKVESTAERLQANGIPALAYHAGMDGPSREHNQERFMREEGMVMVATVAFGMGVDKPNVRFVAHLDPPTSLEAYHQETGRAGRDGLPADAWMTYGLADMAVLRQIVSRDGAQESQAGAREAATPQQAKARERHERIKQQKLTALLGYCETVRCRRQVLLGYFGEDLPQPCGNCDTCLHPVQSWEGTMEAQKALSNIFRTGQRFGAGHLADVLIGKKTPAILRWAHDRVTTFGIGTDRSRKEWMSIYRQLAASGHVWVDMESYGCLKLTDRSWDILKGGEKILFRQDPIQSDRNRTKHQSGNAGFDIQSQILTTQEARALWDRLKGLRLEIAREQGVPPYAVFPDRTLLEMIRYRPRDSKELLCISGVGRVKEETFGQRFVREIEAHEAEHGRPKGLPSLPETAGEQKRVPRIREFTETLKTTLQLFQETGSIEETAGARGLKSATISKHLADCVSLGRITPAEATGLDPGEIETIERVIKEQRANGMTSLSAVFDALDGAYPYEVLRCVRAGMDTGS